MKSSSNAADTKWEKKTTNQTEKTTKQTQETLTERRPQKQPKSSSSNKNNIPSTARNKKT